MLPRGRFSANVLFWVVGVVEDVHLAEVLMVARNMKAGLTMVMTDTEVPMVAQAVTVLDEAARAAADIMPGGQGRLLGDRADRAAERLSMLRMVSRRCCSHL